MLTLNSEQIRRIELTAAVGDVLADHVAVRRALEALDMQPTSQAFELAAGAAVAVLIAHDLGYSNDEIARAPRTAVAVSLNGNGHHPAKRATHKTRGRRKKRAGNPKVKRATTRARQPRVECVVCRKKVVESRFLKHMEKKHPDFQAQELPAHAAAS